jgi:hypothetical protein
MNTWFLILAVYQILVYSTAAANTIPNQDDDPTPDEYQREPAFAIEFTLDHLISSVSLANGSTYALGRVSGGFAYQSLMRQYLETCHQVHWTQDSPLQEMKDAFAKGQQREMLRREHLLPLNRHLIWDWLMPWFFQPWKYSPPPAVFDGDEYSGDMEVEVLSDAIAGLKNSMLYELRHQFNVTDGFPWAYANILVPDFFWTTIKPKPDPELQPDGIVSWYANFDPDSFWFKPIFGKFSAAL